DKISFGGIIVYRKEEPLELAKHMMYHTSCVMSLGSVLLSGMQYYSTLNEDLLNQFSGAVPYGLSWTRKEGTYKSIDIRRCYTRAMCERLPVFNACDTIDVFNGTIHDYAFYYSSAFEM